MRKMKMGEGDLYEGGVKSLLLLKDGKLVVGTGDGTIEVVEIINRKNSHPQKPSKFPNTPQIFTVSYSSLHRFITRNRNVLRCKNKKDTALL